MTNKYTKQKIDLEKAISLYESGMTHYEVAIELETTRKVIWQRFKNHGYKSRVAKKRNQWGGNNHAWKGNDASYACFHKRVHRLKGMPKKCEECGTEDESRSYDWANLTGKYNNPDDYKRMCRSCHWKYDKKILNIKKMR